MAAVQATINLAEGKPPRSGIERRIKLSLQRREAEQDTMISWVRSHTGIKGNEKADHHADFAAALGDIAGTTGFTTERGVRAISKNTRKSASTSPGFGNRRVEWHRHAISAYRR